MTFEISFTLAGRNFDVTYTAYGKLYQIEKTIDPASLPASVRSKLSQEFGEYRIDTAEQLVRDDGLFYQVKLR
jgi:hypothetical protein